MGTAVRDTKRAHVYDTTGRAGWVEGASGGQERVGSVVAAVWQCAVQVTGEEHQLPTVSSIEAHERPYSRNGRVVDRCTATHTLLHSQIFKSSVLFVLNPLCAEAILDHKFGFLQKCPSETMTLYLHPPPLGSTYTQPCSLIDPSRPKYDQRHHWPFHPCALIDIRHFERGMMCQASSNAVESS
jgi:hypothetical protein